MLLKQVNELHLIQFGIKMPILFFASLSQYLVKRWFISEKSCIQSTHQKMFQWHKLCPWHADKLHRISISAILRVIVQFPVFRRIPIQRAALFCKSGYRQTKITAARFHLLLRVIHPHVQVPPRSHCACPATDDGGRFRSTGNAIWLADGSVVAWKSWTFPNFLKQATEPTERIDPRCISRAPHAKSPISNSMRTAEGSCTAWTRCYVSENQQLHVW